MRALHVIQALAPRYGGPSTTIFPMLAALNRIPGVAAEVAATDADGPGGRIDPATLPKGVFLHLFPRTFSEQWKYSFGLGRWLRLRAKNYDVIHIHGIWSYGAAAAARAARRARTPYIIRPAGMLSEYCLNVKAFKKRLYWAAVERKTIRHAAGFHATGEDEVRDIRMIRSDARTFLIPQGLDAQAFDVPTDGDELRKRCGDAAGGRPIVLFLGRLHPVKGLTDLLLPAFAGLKADAFLAIVGGPDAQAPGYEKAIGQQIDRLGLADRVALLGPVRPEQRWHLFDGAALSVLPSHSENFGMTVVESMARGCPVVVTKAVQAHTHVAASGAGRVVPLKPEALRDALDDLLAHPEVTSTMGQAGRGYVRRHLAWDGVAERIHAMYQTVVTEARLS